MLVSTVSDCGFTDQCSDLQKLHEANKDKLAIIAFLAYDFKEQEKASDIEIAQFYKINFGVSFPHTEKVSVLKRVNQN